jgi:hypothetical protein
LRQKKEDFVRRQQVYQILWFTMVLAAASLACSLVSDIGEQAGGIRDTAQAVGTGVQSGRELLQTGQAFATEVMGNETVQTARAVITQEAPGVIDTARAFATAEGPGLLETAQAFATQDAPGLLETAQALATSFIVIPSEAPADVPIMEGEKEDLYTSPDLVSYTISADLNAVKDFYDREMPSNGWEKQEGQTIETDQGVLMAFQKGDRSASVTLSVQPGTSNTVVVVTLGGP